jgi:hypothetical protein
MTTATTIYNNVTISVSPGTVKNFVVPVVDASTWSKAVINVKITNANAEYGQGDVLTIYYAWAAAGETTSLNLEGVAKSFKIVCPSEASTTLFASSEVHFATAPALYVWLKTETWKNTRVIDANVCGVEVLAGSAGSIAAGTNSIGQIQPSKYPTSDDAEYKNKYYTSTGAATDGIVWSPASGKRWYITDLIVSVSAATTVTFEDDLTAGDNVVLKADLAANGGFCKRFVTPLASGEDAADLLVTTTAGNLYVTATGYEV